MKPSYVVVAVAGSDMVYLFNDIVDSRRAMKARGISPKDIQTRLMRNGVKLDYPGRDPKRHDRARS